jgi:ribonuclease P protein component
LSSPAADARDGSASPPETARDDRGFPRSYRLTARKQFQTVYRQGSRVRSASFSLFALPNELGHCRLGITVTRKVGGAVERNKVKRMVREIFRNNVDDLKPDVDLVFHAYPGIDTTDRAALEREFLKRFSDLGRRVEKSRGSGTRS